MKKTPKKRKEKRFKIYEQKTIFMESIFTVVDSKDCNLKIAEFFGPNSEILAKAFAKAINVVEWRDILRNGGYLRKAKKRSDMNWMQKLLGGTV